MVTQFHKKLHTISNKTVTDVNTCTRTIIDDDSNNEAESVRNSFLV